LRVIVLGAGVVGVTSAYRLLQEGHEVVVIERQTAAGMETSWGNGAMIHVSSVQPWAAPGVPTNILKWLGQERAPMLLRLSALPFMWRWGLGFLRNCAPQAYKDNCLFNLKLALESASAMARIRAATGIAYDFAADSVLKIYPTEAKLAAALADHQILAPYGLLTERWDKATCLAREPALVPVQDQVAGGLFFPQDEIGDCNKFSQGLASWCAAHGAVFHYETTAKHLAIEAGRVVGVQTDRGRYDAAAVVVALGCHSPFMVKALSLDLPIYPVKGISLTTQRHHWPAAPRMAILDDVRHVGLVPVGDRLRAVGSAEIARYDTRPSPGRIDMLTDWVCELFPDFRHCAAAPDAIPWAGLRPVVPNGRPWIGATKVSGLWLNTGHGHTGWTMAAGSADRLVHAMRGKTDAAASAMPVAA
jgi:D-amino-acid dehydrogenase